MPLHIASFDDIRAGKTTDVYFERTRRVLEAEGRNPRVRAEFMAKALPHGWPWGLLAGVEECVALLVGRAVTVRAMAEGTPFRPLQPVLEIEGPYLEFGLLETAVLGLLCQATGIATAAARCKKLAGERLVLSFGARRLHPAISPMIERAAYIGGCDGVSSLAAAQLIRHDPTGTIPHALILIMGDTVDAVRAFDRVIEPGVPRVALIDTFQDEKFEAVRVAEALGEALAGVRLDTPSSRRGDFLQLLREVRWELDLRGFRHVRIYVSGGIGEEEIQQLASVVDGFGVGGDIAAAPIVDFSMDLVEIEGRPLAKRGKWSGAKQVWRCPRCGVDEVLPLVEDGGPCPCGGRREPLLQPLLIDGGLAAPLPTPDAIRERALRQVAAMGTL
ncbi:MAG: nicotinate phosphoribosyltransferase [Chloroflexi bacterium RBG_16_68_14]|nr:MAG: nicotinate phosphoribosyltransferase [Chloroflexi bacterium RBG_16_68_14]